MKQSNDVADTNTETTTNENIQASNKTGIPDNDKKTDAKNNEALKNDSNKQQEDKKDDKKDKQPSPLEKLFCNQLKDIYYAEHQLLQALPKMEQAATTEQLKEAFSDHTHQTQKHVKRVEKVFAILGKQPEEKKCEVIDALIKAADTIINETQEDSLTRDAALIIAAQKVEHYEIASYGGLVQLALTLDFDDAADILDTTLMEEEDTDELLTEIAENDVNVQAEDEDFEIVEESVYAWK